MRYGQICRGCKGIEKCKQIPGMDIFNIVELPCHICGGENFTECSACGKTGVMPIIGCPETLITADVWEMMELAKFYEKGLPPIAGGVLDQTQSFISAAAFIFGEENVWKAKLGITN